MDRQHSKYDLDRAAVIMKYFCFNSTLNALFGLKTVQHSVNGIQIETNTTSDEEKHI